MYNLGLPSVTIDLGWAIRGDGVQDLGLHDVKPREDISAGMRERPSLRPPRDTLDPIPVSDLHDAVVLVALGGRQDHRCQRAGLPVLLEGGSEITVGDGVAVDHHETPSPAKLGLGPFQTPCRTQDHRFLGVGHPDAQTAAVADRPSDRIGSVVQVDHDLGYALAPEVIKGVHDQ
jgi:hypothetical protein